MLTPHPTPDAPGEHALYDVLPPATGQDRVIIRFRVRQRDPWQEIVLNSYDAMALSNRLHHAAVQAFHGAPATYNSSEREMQPPDTMVFVLRD